MLRHSGWLVLLLVGCGAAPEQRPVAPPPVIATGPTTPPDPPAPPPPPPAPARATPFDALDGAQLTVIQLQTGAAKTAGPKPTHYPLPPQLRALGRPALEQLEKQGILPPGLLPPAQPASPPRGKYRAPWDIADRRPVVDGATQTQLLDLLGAAESFTADPAQCFNPTMVVSFASPAHAEPQDVVVSLSCKQVVSYGFVWPHAATGLTPEAHQTLKALQQRLFGTVPPGS